MNNQLNIFDLMYDKYKITKPIRLIELFAGYGSQSLALKYLGVDFEHYMICEWAVKSIQAYKDIHFPNDNIDYSKQYTKEELVDILYDLGISTNYNEPATKQQIKKLDVRKIYNNIKATHNCVNVQKAHLDIKDSNSFTYLLTYSFPCITKDSLILTKHGYKEYEDLQIGEYVLTKSNTWQKIVKKFDNGVHQTYYLQGMGFENIHCTDNHKFLVREMYRKGHNNIRCFKEPIFKEVKNITKKDYFGVPVIKEEKEFYTNDLDFWYMIGYYLGDGWLSNKGYDIKLSCNEEKLKKLKSHLNFEKYKYTINDNKTCYNLRFSNKEIYNFIKENIGTGCEQKRISGELLLLPKEQLQSLYQGYLDSDGCIIKNKHQFSSINKQLIYSLGIIINKLYKRPVSIYKIKVKPKKIIDGRIVNQKNWYQLRFNCNVSKQDKAFYDNGYIWYPFTKLEKADKENVYNMEVENDHSYIIQGCISKNCQDLSLAGKGAGMDKESGTRSGMLWEVERMLDECKQKGEMPQILLMENVTQVVGTNNLDNFILWTKKLEELGYKNYFQNMIATDYGIPQTRDRTFMVSILGDYSYTFPRKMKLEIRLKDLLEKDVDEKYYLSKKMIEFFKENSINNEQKGNGFRFSPVELENANIEKTITTRAGGRMDDNYISTNIINKRLKKLIDNTAFGDEPLLLDTYNQVAKKDVSITLTTGISSSNNTFIYIPEKTKKGYVEAHEDDGVYIGRPLSENKIKEYDVIRHSYSSKRLNEWENRNVEQNNISPTLDTRCDCLGVCVPILESCQQINNKNENVEKNINYFEKRLVPFGTYFTWEDNSNHLNTQCNRAYAQDTSIGTITTINGLMKVIEKPYDEILNNINKNNSDLRIRKLTPRECFRLMGVKDEDFEKVSKNQSNSSLYHLAGDSIVTTCLMGIFGELLDINYIDKINEVINNIKEV